MAAIDSKVTEDDLSGFSVVPRTTCPHVRLHIKKLDASVETVSSGSCPECTEDTTSMMRCLSCFETRCGRGAKAHMVEHSEKTGHAIVMGLEDLSVWCYGCDSYLDCLMITELHPVYTKVHNERFGADPELPSTAHSGCVEGGSTETEESKDATADASAGAGAGAGAAASTTASAVAESAKPAAEVAAPAAAPAVAGFADTSSWSAEQKAKLRDRIKGLIYGNCIGDAVGLSTEFMSKRDATRAYGDSLTKGTYEYKDVKLDMHRHRWAPGDWTDDSDQMLLLARSLVEHNGDVVPSDFGRKLVHWMHHGFPELGDTGGMGIGYTVLSVLRHPYFGEDPEKASHAVWQRSGRALAANGAVMRTSIMAVPHFTSLDAVVADTVKMARVTHYDPRCVASCVAVTYAMALMLQGKHETADGDFDTAALTEEAITAALKHLPEGCDSPADKTKYGYFHDHAVEMLRKHFTAKTAVELKLDEDDKIGYTYKCAGSGFVALRAETDFRKAMGAIIAEAGDADTNGAVAGAMLGCRLGYTKLAKEAGSWISKIPRKQLDFLEASIASFFKAMAL